MARQTTDTPVRRYERVQCRLPASVRVAPGTDQNRVRLSPTVCDSEGWVSAEFIDLSRGGAGLRSPVFLPRGVRVEVRVSGAPVCLETLARVQRTTMADPAPTYLLGVSFEYPTPGFQETIGVLLSTLGGAAAGVQPGA